MNDILPIKLTQYSHGAGCGCKIAPKVLDQILRSNITMPDNDKLIVGNHSKDDAAVFDLGNGMALISTTDFFMPIVDDPHEFGRIAAANAISDVYAMGGKPILAIAILGWPVNTLSPDIAQTVIEGGRSICQEAGISLAGGHSIDSPEPIFGLAVSGVVPVSHIKRNNTAMANNNLYLTKPLGVGILTTAEKKGILKKEHLSIASNQMMQLNKVGEVLGSIDAVTAMTDVTGFGLLGHLIEMAEGSNLSAEVYFEKLPLITQDLGYYIALNSMPGGTARNWDSYGTKVTGVDKFNEAILADPQTSGGLLIAVEDSDLPSFESTLTQFGLHPHLVPIGRFISRQEFVIYVR